MSDQDHMASRDHAHTSSDGHGALPMPSHTPGPWVCKMQFGEWFVRQDPANWDGNGYQLICCLPAGRKKTLFGEMFAANARLIAAAPDLLSALKGLLPEDWADDDTMDHLPGVKAARLAIAKALGDGASSRPPVIEGEGSRDEPNSSARQALKDTQ